MKDSGKKVWRTLLSLLLLLEVSGISGQQPQQPSLLIADDQMAGIANKLFNNMHNFPEAIGEGMSGDTKKIRQNLRLIASVLGNGIISRFVDNPLDTANRLGFDLEQLGLNKTFIEKNFGLGAPPGLSSSITRRIAHSNAEAVGSLKASEVNNGITDAHAKPEVLFNSRGTRRKGDLSEQPELQSLSTFLQQNILDKISSSGSRSESSLLSAGKSTQFNEDFWNLHATSHRQRTLPNTQKHPVDASEHAVASYTNTFVGEQRKGEHQGSEAFLQSDPDTLKLRAKKL